jgi:hypothetical protein
MAFDTASRSGGRFLGKKNKREAHDQHKEDRSAPGGQIDEFRKAGHGVYIRPDTLEQARSERYDNSAKCIGGSRR